MDIPDTLIGLYRFPGFEPRARLVAEANDPEGVIVTLDRRPQRYCGVCGQSSKQFHDTRWRNVRDLSAGDRHVTLRVPIYRLVCHRCGGVKTERLDGLARNPFCTARFARHVGRRCRSSPLSDVADELGLDWHTVKALDKEYMQQQLDAAGRRRRGSSASTKSPSQQGTAIASSSAI